MRCCYTGDDRKQKNIKKGLCTTYLIKMHIYRNEELVHWVRERESAMTQNHLRRVVRAPWYLTIAKIDSCFFLFKPVEVTNHYIQDTQDVCIQISNATFDRCYSKLEEEDEPRCSPLRAYKNATMFLNTPSSQIPTTRSTTERSCRSLSLPPSRIALPPPTPPRRKAPLPPSLSR